MWTCCCQWLSADCTIRLVRFSILCYQLYWIDKSDSCSVSVLAAATDNHAVSTTQGEIAPSRRFILSVRFSLEPEHFPPALLCWWALGVNNCFANAKSSCLWQVPSIYATEAERPWAAEQPSPLRRPGQEPWKCPATWNFPNFAETRANNLLHRHSKCYW